MRSPYCPPPPRAAAFAEVLRQVTVIVSGAESDVGENRISKLSW